MSGSTSSPSIESIPSPSTFSFQSSTSPKSYPQNGHLSHPNLPPLPPFERIPPPKGRSTQQTGQKFKIMRKGKGKAKDREKDNEDEDWTLEGLTSNGYGEEHSGPLRPIEQEIPSILDSQLTEMPAQLQKHRKKLKPGSLAKKTSRLFARAGDKDRSSDTASSSALTPDSNSPLSMPSGSPQPSHSSTASNETNGSSRNYFPPLNRPYSSNSVSRSPRSNGSRRPSQESQRLRSAHEPSMESGRPPIVSQRPSSHQGASAPNLSRQALPQPAGSTNGSFAVNHARNGETFPTRMSTWFSHLLPSASSTAVSEPSHSSAPTETPASSSPPHRKPPSAAASFLSAARQRAVEGVRHLLDSEAQPDKCPDTMWVLGVAHPGWRPTTPDSSPAQQFSDLPEYEDEGRRGSDSSGKPSPPPKIEAGALRPAAWAKRKEVLVTSSPPSKSFGNIFSTSTLSLALPASMASGSPIKDSDGRGTLADSPSKMKSGKAEKEVLKWPEQCMVNICTILQADSA